MGGWRSRRYSIPTHSVRFFTARRNAGIASAVLATAITSVCPSVRLSHAGIVSKRRQILAQSIAFRVVSIYWQGVAPFP